MIHDFRGIGEKTLLLNARRLAGEDHRDEMILLAIEDITDRQNSHTKLMEADRRKNNFLAILAHELRNPLTPIRLGIGLLRRDAKEATVKQFDMIERQIQRLVRLVDGLLDIARIERDHVELKKVPVDLINVVNQAIETSHHHFDIRRHKLSLFLPSEPVRILADPGRLEQVASNLLSNAAKYTDNGGEIAVSVERVDDDAVLRIRDNGIGIAPELLPQLFEMFFQADASLDRAGSGLGIGLSVAKRLVDLHGGRIEGHSEGLGRGSEFTIHLPAIRESKQSDWPQEQMPESSAVVFTTHRVLIVDDNFDTAEIVAEIARHWGHEVEVAQDGPSALELASKFLPEIALVDIGLPKMDGYELARRLRKLPGMEAVPLVAITGYGRDEDRRQARDAGFALHLVKPVDPVRLERLLATLS